MDTARTVGGRYRLAGLLGVGGTARVYRAHDLVDGGEVAVKLLRPDAGEVEGQRLRREVELLRRVDHPNVVRVLADGLADTPAWFAMDLVDGPDLRALLRREGAQQGAFVRRLLAGLVAALECLHGRGLVHRDLTPANVLLTTEPGEGEWEVRLGDLGAAQHVDSDHLTAAGSVIGTVGYLSPEQACGSPVTAASDVFALGLIAIEALTGAAPYPGTAAESTAARLVRGPHLPTGLDAEWGSLLCAMTALHPADRPTTGQVAERLARLPDVAAEEGAGEDRALQTTRQLTTQLPAVVPPVQRTEQLRVLSEEPAPKRRRMRPLVLLMVAASVTCGVGLVGSLLSALPAAVTEWSGTVAANDEAVRPSSTPSASHATGSGAAASTAPSAAASAATDDTAVAEAAAPEAPQPPAAPADAAAGPAAAPAAPAAPRP